MVHLQAQIAAHRERNIALLKSIESHGISLTEQRPTEHFFITKREADATKLAQDLKSRGFEKTELRKDGSFFSSKFHITAVIVASPNGVTDEKFVSDLVQSAMSRNAIFDGWGMLLG
jgi:hypothetical protein